MPPKFEFPRPTPDEKNPRGVTIAPGMKFDALPEALQQQVKNREITLAAAHQAAFGEVTPGAYSVPLTPEDTREIDTLYTVIFYRVDTQRGQVPTCIKQRH